MKYIIIFSPAFIAWFAGWLLADRFGLAIAMIITTFFYFLVAPLIIEFIE